MKMIWMTARPGQTIRTLSNPFKSPLRSLRLGRDQSDDPRYTEPTDTPPNSATVPPRRSHDKPTWLVQKEAIQRNFPDGWNPPRKISRPAMSLLRTLHARDPQQFSLPVLAQRFRISPEAVRRVLRSKWEPDQNTLDKLEKRAEKTGRSRGTNQAWIDYERLETEQKIPSNLISSLRSSFSSSSSSPSYVFQSSHPRSNNRSTNSFRLNRSHESRLELDDEMVGAFKTSTS